jgi:hypothetical protein
MPKAAKKTRRLAASATPYIAGRSSCLPERALATKKAAIWSVIDSIGKVGYDIVERCLQARG